MKSGEKPAIFPEDRGKLVREGKAKKQDVRTTRRLVLSKKEVPLIRKKEGLH